MAAKYTIVNTQSTIYLDKQNKPINGFIVTFQITQFDEIYSLRVPVMNAGAIDKEISKLVIEREKLSGA